MSHTAVACVSLPQVDSEEGTLAANYWWEGAVSRQLGGPMDRCGHAAIIRLL